MVNFIIKIMDLIIKVVNFITKLRKILYPIKKKIIILLCILLIIAISSVCAIIALLEYVHSQPGLSCRVSSGDWTYDCEECYLYQLKIRYVLEKAYIQMVLEWWSNRSDVLVTMWGLNCFCFFLAHITTPEKKWSREEFFYITLTCFFVFSYFYMVSELMTKFLAKYLFLSLKDFIVLVYGLIFFYWFLRHAIITEYWQTVEEEHRYMIANFAVLFFLTYAGFYFLGK
jgi:hypothetical protein